jgi:glutamate-5-semialdehyde dehydrogenase
MGELGRRARKAARQVALASPDQKNAALRAMAGQIRARRDGILEANARDMAEARAKGQAASYLDRLALDAWG